MSYEDRDQNLQNIKSRKNSIKLSALWDSEKNGEDVNLSVRGVRKIL